MTLIDPAGVDSDFAGVPIVWSEITIEIGAIPEPATWSTLVLMGIVSLRRISRRLPRN